MADLYVSSVDGSDADNGATWALAKATVAGALAVAANGDTIYVDSAHSYSSAAAAITWNPASAAFTRIVSVNRNGSTTTGHSGWLAGATEQVTGNFAFNVGSASTSLRLYIWGLTVSLATGNINQPLNIATGTNAICSVEMESCTLKCPGSNSGQRFTIGGSFGGVVPTRAKFANCVFYSKDNTSGGAFSLQKGVFEFCGCSHVFSGSNKSAALIQFAGVTAQATTFTMLACDWSSFNTSGGALVSVTNWEMGEGRLVNCKLSGTPAVVSGTWSNNLPSLTLINADSGDTHNVFEYRNRLGTITENTSKYANTGAQFDGSGISWEIITTASCSEQEPFVTPWLMRWADEISSRTVSLELAHDSATALTNRTAWPEWEYLGDASFPLGTLSSGRFGTPFEGTAADWSSSSEAWTGISGFTNPSKQTLAATFTPAERSLLRARLNVGAASKTLYLDPALRISGHAANPPTRWTPLGAINVEPSSGVIVVED